MDSAAEESPLLRTRRSPLPDTPSAFPGPRAWRYILGAAPSNFGTVSFKLFADKKELLLELGDEMEAVNAKQVLWHLPFKPSRVIVDGKVTPGAASPVVLPHRVSKAVAVK
jgi:hypothetical protein